MTDSPATPVPCSPHTSARGRTPARAGRRGARADARRRAARRGLRRRGAAGRRRRPFRRCGRHAHRCHAGCHLGRRHVVEPAVIRARAALALSVRRRAVGFDLRRRRPHRRAARRPARHLLLPGPRAAAAPAERHQVRRGRGRDLLQPEHPEPRADPGVVAQLGRRRAEPREAAAAADDGPGGRPGAAAARRAAARRRQIGASSDPPARRGEPGRGAARTCWAWA